MVVQDYGVLLAFVVLGVATSAGQKYVLGQADTGEYYREELSNPPLTFYQDSPFHPSDYYVPKDLQTSELPVHLQHNLPQYHQQQQTHIPFPFRLDAQYVKPSTHRPDYSHVLPHQYHVKNRNNVLSEDHRINPLNELSRENNNKIDSHYNKRDSKEVVEEEPTNGNDDNELDDEEYDEEEEYEYDEDEEEENEPEKGDARPQTNETYEILTNKPAGSDSPNSFKDFVDVESMDTTTQQPATSNLFTQSPADTGKKDDFLVVSVVTSKTIVNNTIISPMVEDPLRVSTESSLAPNENSTDSWIVIASVQTSRSISGARYIPSSVVDQDERIQLLNEPSVTTEPIRNMAETETIAPTVTSTVSSAKTSTESLIDKLDRVQSDLTSGLLTGGFKNDNIVIIEENSKLETTSEATSTPKSASTKKPYPQVNIRKFNPENRAARPKPKPAPSKPKVQPPPKESLSSILQKVKPVDDISALLPPGYKMASTTENDSPLFKIAKPVDDISALLPPGYKPPSTEAPIGNILPKIKPVDDISALLPPGYRPPASTTTESILSKASPVVDISALLPPGYKLPTSTEKSPRNNAIKPLEDISALLPPGFKLSASSTTDKSSSERILSKAKPVEDISALLPPGYKPPSGSTASSILAKAKPVDDISALLPPGYKPAGSSDKSVSGLLAKAKPVDDISALLPPGYRKGFSKSKVTTTESSVSLETVSQNIPANLLPPGFKTIATQSSTNESSTPTMTESTSTASPPSESGFKVVFPSRPGGGARKTPRLTTPRPQNQEINKPKPPTIQKGWPVRASTEFTGWPTPSTTPISIEKLLEAARAAATSTSIVTPTEPSSTTTTSTTTTTTPKPTTPGICVDGCDLVGTIKLIGGAKWVPELLDRNTKEYQILANSVQSELESIYNSSPVLKKWYRKIRIDGFSEGSILVDYLVEFNEIGRKVDTQEIKKLFHESLMDITDGTSNREAKSLNETRAERFTVGQFELDPKYTDFVVIPKQSMPTVSYADDVLLPQWAIAVIVIGLASLLFVIIFGVTVLFNRHKNSKKTPAPLTEDMLNELNKNHMGGLEHYGIDDFYNMEDVWSDKHYEQKPHKKRPANGSVYDNSTTNLYDSWRSQWNGGGPAQWGAYNGYYGHPTSQHSGHSLRRPNIDTNF